MREDRSGNSFGLAPAELSDDRRMPNQHVTAGPAPSTGRCWHRLPHPARHGATPQCALPVDRHKVRHVSKTSSDVTQCGRATAGARSECCSRKRLEADAASRKDLTRGSSQRRSPFDGKVVDEPPCLGGRIDRARRASRQPGGVIAMAVGKDMAARATDFSALGPMSTAMDHDAETASLHENTPYDGDDGGVDCLVPRHTYRERWVRSSRPCFPDRRSNGPIANLFIVH